VVAPMTSLKKAAPDNTGRGAWFCRKKRLTARAMDKGELGSNDGPCGPTLGVGLES